MRRPRTDPGRAVAIAGAQSAAAEVPLRTATAAAEVAELAAELLQTGNPNLSGDAATGVLLADAACVAAANLVAINLAGHPGDARIAAAHALVARSARARTSVG